MQIQDRIVGSEKIDWRKLKPFQPHNLKDMSKESFELLKNSIKESNFMASFDVWRENEDNYWILDGHHRKLALEALIAEGWEIPDQLHCTFIHCEDSQDAAYVIIAKASSHAKMNELGLTEFITKNDLDFQRLIDTMDINNIDFQKMWDENQIGDIEPEGDEDETPELKIEATTKLGDVWILGDHRLMCGDSTNSDSFTQLVNNNKIDLVFTDPPYNLGYKYNSYDDNKTPEAYFEFCMEWFNTLNLFTSRIIITPGQQNLGMWFKIMNPTGIAIWVKKNAMSGCKIANLNLWEPILFFGDFKRSSRPSDLFEVNLKQQKDTGNHSCHKQVELIEDIISHYSPENGIIDAFGGSGTTLIVCEKLKKKSYLMEFDPAYCDVIIKRWQNYSGKKAVHEGTQKTFDELSPLI